jgi:predicted nucleic acid-binding protein
MQIQDGFWERVGRLRVEVLAKRRKARLGDALVAQFCIDHDVPLLTRDHDFRAFVDIENFKIVVAP